MAPGIVLVGLGPGAPEHLTQQAWDWLNTCGEIWLRTAQHPTVIALPGQERIHSFDALYEHGERFEAVYEEMVEEVLSLGRRAQGVTYAVPGHPYVAEATCPEIVRRAKEEGLPVRVIEGLSFLEPVFRALALDPFPNLVLVDAMEVSTTLMPQFSPAQPALVAQIYSREIAAQVKATLNTVYPDQHPVVLVHAAGTPEQKIERIPLYEIDRSRAIGLLSVLYLPALAADSSFEHFQEIIARLRAPDGCPWDREQTHLSLRKYLLEETYEALAVLDAEDSEGMREEFGDLLLQIVLHAQIGFEEGEFSMADILQGISQKLVRRHPHVFGEEQVEDVKGVLQNWEKLKAQEKKDDGRKKYRGLLDGVPKEFPALSQAQQIQDRAARVNFEWPNQEAIWQALMDSIEALRGSRDDVDLAGEFGALFFAAAGLARRLDVDAESALRETLLRYRQRFAALEKQAQAEGRAVAELRPAALQSLWIKGL